MREDFGKFKTILKARLTHNVCVWMHYYPCPIHKGKVMITDAFTKSGWWCAEDKRRKACFISQFHDFPQSEISWSKNLLLKILICWCLTEVRSDKGHLRRQSGFSWQQPGARVPSMIVLIRSDSRGMKDVRLLVMMWCHNRLPPWPGVSGDHQQCHTTLSGRKH